MFPDLGKVDVELDLLLQLNLNHDYSTPTTTYSRNLRQFQGDDLVCIPFAFYSHKLSGFSFAGGLDWASNRHRSISSADNKIPKEIQGRYMPSGNVLLVN
jgi:hypothetical protein